VTRFDHSLNIRRHLLRHRLCFFLSELNGVFEKLPELFAAAAALTLAELVGVSAIFSLEHRAHAAL
jgi:hypothetical protein